MSYEIIQKICVMKHFLQIDTKLIASLSNFALLNQILFFYNFPFVLHFSIQLREKNNL